MRKRSDGEEPDWIRRSSDVDETARQKSGDIY